MCAQTFLRQKPQTTSEFEPGIVHCSLNAHYKMQNEKSTAGFDSLNPIPYTLYPIPTYGLAKLAVAGNFIVMVVPSPGVESSWIEPESFINASFTMYSPSPEPLDLSFAR